ncbi:MAG: sel1 repeat family protein [Hyphomonadaceae bacterium]|nr:sel1 repeat family protein [Hyphomonadaceae bacterium]
MRLGVAVFSLALVLAAPSARAELGVGISSDAEHQMLLVQRPPSMQAELIGLADNDIPLFGPVDCATLGARHLQTARSGALSIEVIVARYNIVNVWTGNLCAEGNDVSVQAREARAWLAELAGLRRAEDGAAFIDARRRFAEMLVFGAPGQAPDYAEARRYLSTEAEADPAMLLYLAFLDENGLGGAPDLAQAFQHLHSAGARGVGEAEALLAQASELGLLGQARDETDAVARYERLAESVNPPVWFRLGRMLLDGRGAARDPCRAQVLLHRARSHAWNPVLEADQYLDRIREEGLCRS